uniref:Putative capsid morphogenesis protein n=1 Tax=viral metagenome TaxID=1070528 RepID=A0A6M3IQ69_9ZZZZ
MTVKQLDNLDSFSTAWIAERSLLLATSINLTTMEAIKAELVLGMQAGESIQQLTKRIGGYFDETKKWKAKQIARTEVITSANEGSLRRYEKEGINKSEFYPSPDACSVCQALAGEYQTNEAHGMITGETHPNCRCVMLPVV